MKLSLHSCLRASGSLQGRLKCIKLDLLLLSLQADCQVGCMGLSEMYHGCTALHRICLVGLSFGAALQARVLEEIPNALLHEAASSFSWAHCMHHSLVQV